MEYPQFPPETSEQEAKFINDTIIDWSLGNGLTMLTPEGHGVTAVHAPVTVYPSPFPKSGFETALEVQKTFNKLYARVSDDKEWLTEALQEYVIKTKKKLFFFFLLLIYFFFFEFKLF